MAKKKLLKQQQAKREEYALLLSRFAEFLTKQGVVPDAGPIVKAASECRSNRNDGRWGYVIERLLFRSLGTVKSFQKKFDLSNATLELSLKVEGLCDFEGDGDPLTILELNIDLSGSYQNAAKQPENAFCSWHLDRHDLAGVPEFSHPRYHLSFGGKHLESILGTNDVVVLLLDSPRLPHPPLDAILAVDFVLTNFIGRSRCGFRTDSTYVSLVNEMQKVLWKPYADSLHAHWQPRVGTAKWDPVSIWTSVL